MTITPFRTQVDAAAIHPAGWERLPSGAWLTRHPLLDADVGGAALARLTYRDALHAAELHGARLPSRAEVVEGVAVARRAGVVLRPVTLSFGPEMVARPHAELHDRLVAEQLAAARWDGRSLVAGAGKHWVAGAGRGRSRICGWPTAEGGLIQAGTADVHDDAHHDYATTTLLARDVAPVDEVADTDPAPAPWDLGLADDARLGLRCLAWLGYHAGLDPREVPGPRHDARILSYSAQCRRGGTLLGVGAVGAPIWHGGTPLPLGADEDAWCAALASATLLAAMRVGDVPPHGLRVSVRELVEDARATGALRPVGHEPRPGDLAIEARARGDPLKGGTGHVRRVVQVLGGGFYLGVGGNERDRITTAVHRLDGPAVRGWIAYP